MNRLHLRPYLAIAIAALSGAAACRHAAPPPPPPPVPLSDSASTALLWVQTHAMAFDPADSVASPAERTAIFSLTRGARVIGFSEMNEGTHEFTYIIRRTVLALADS